MTIDLPTSLPSLQDKLEFLYPGHGDAVHRRLRAILDEYRPSHRSAPKRTPMFTEEDVVLIAYADHVQEPGQETLQTMREFLHTYAHGQISRVHFLPFYPYSSDDGFSVIDYFRVNDGFGDWTDVDDISREFELMFDFVINHASAESAWFRDFLAAQPPFDQYFIAFDEPVDVSSVFRPRTNPLLTPFETADGKKYVWTTFSTDQIDVNFHNPDVLLEYVRILLFYLSHGATVVRLDAIAYLWKQLGTSCLHLPQTHTVVKLVRQVLEEVAPNTWIITETNVPHQDNISYFGNGKDEAHLVYNFALPPLLLYSFLRGNATELTRWAQTLRPPSEETAFFNFTASHDGIGVTALRALIAPEEFQAVLDAVVDRGGKISYRAVPGQDPVPYELNVVYLDAVGGVEPFLASQAIALALQGVPGIYLNSLIGARNWEEGVEQLGYNRAINRQKFNYGELADELADPSSIKHRVYDAYTTMLRARQSEPLFSPMADQAILDLDDRVFAVRRSDGTGRLLALTNVSDQEVPLDAARLRQELGTEQAEDLLADGTVGLQGAVTLRPHEVRWLKGRT